MPLGAVPVPKNDTVYVFDPQPDNGRVGDKIEAFHRFQCQLGKWVRTAVEKQIEDVQRQKDADHDGGLAVLIIQQLPPVPMLQIEEQNQHIDDGQRIQRDAAFDIHPADPLSQRFHYSVYHIRPDWSDLFSDFLLSSTS